MKGKPESLGGKGLGDYDVIVAMEPRGVCTLQSESKAVRYAWNGSFPTSSSWVF